MIGKKSFTVYTTTPFGKNCSNKLNYDQNRLRKQNFKIQVKQIYKLIGYYDFWTRHMKRKHYFF